MLIMVNVDFNKGFTLPDSKVSDWVKSQIDQATKQKEPVILTIGSVLIIAGFRYWSKKLKLNDGDIQLTYSDGTQDKIDNDGNIHYVPKGSGLHNEFLLYLM